MNKKPSQALLDFMNSFRSYYECARALGISYGTVSHWINGNRLPSKINCYKIEKVSNGKYKHYEIRPELFGDKNHEDK